MQAALEIADRLAPFHGEMSSEDYKDLLDSIGATPESLKRDAATLREWACSQPHLPNLSSEYDEWLVKFIVGSKNSMEKAKLRLDKYFQTRNVLADWFVLDSIKEEEMRLCTRFLHMGCMPKLLPGGDVLFLEQLQSTDAKGWSSLDVGRRFQMGIMLFDQALAINRKTRGLVYVVDVQNISMDWVTMLLASTGKFRKFVNCLQDTMPTKIQAIHIVNAFAPSILRTAMNILTPMLKDKLGQRIFIHDNLKSLHDTVPAAYLPESFGGTVTTSMKELAESSLKTLSGCKEFFESRTWMQSDETRRPNTSPPSEYGVEGSFRKLAVD